MLEVLVSIILLNIILFMIYCLAWYNANEDSCPCGKTIKLFFNRVKNTCQKEHEYIEYVLKGKYRIYYICKNCGARSVGPLLGEVELLKLGYSIETLRKLRYKE